MAELSLLRLLTWLSPAFPTGGFAYSHGLEWAVEAGDVRDEASLTAWMEDMLRLGALWSDAILLRLAHRGEDVAGTRAWRFAPQRSGAWRAARRGRPSPSPPPPGPALAWDDAPLPYPVAVGKLAAAHDIAEDDTTLAFLHAASANLVSAAIRLIPLGQAAGLRVQAALEPAILAIAQRQRHVRRGRSGRGLLGSDIAAMRHETQYTRLFRS